MWQELFLVEAEVPFAHHVVPVSLRPEPLRQQGRVQGQPVRLVCVDVLMLHACVDLQYHSAKCDDSNELYLSLWLIVIMYGGLV